MKLQDANMNTALHYACESGNIDLASFLMEKGSPLVKYNVKGWLPLHCGISSKLLIMFKLLEKKYEQFFEAKNRADITVLNIRTESLDTPLILSITLDSIDIFNYLIN
jgi:ankyrin repeat protein